MPATASMHHSAPRSIIFQDSRSCFTWLGGGSTVVICLAQLAESHPLVPGANCTNCERAGTQGARRAAVSGCGRSPHTQPTPNWVHVSVARGRAHALVVVPACACPLLWGRHRMQTTEPPMHCLLPASIWQRSVGPRCRVPPAAARQTTAEWSDGSSAVARAAWAAQHACRAGRPALRWGWRHAGCTSACVQLNACLEHWLGGLPCLHTPCQGRDWDASIFCQVGSAADSATCCGMGA